jgi:hypothetical protein
MGSSAENILVGPDSGRAERKEDKVEGGSGKRKTVSGKNTGHPRIR